MSDGEKGNWSGKFEFGAARELSEIAEDKQMTAQEKGTRINALMQGLPAKVREELQSAMAMGGGGPQQPEQFRSPL